MADPAPDRTYYLIAKGAEQSGGNLTPEHADRLRATGYDLRLPGQPPPTPPAPEDPIAAVRAEALAAAEAQAHTVIETGDGCGCPNCSTRLPDRRLIHCSMSFTGADWDLAEVLDAIRAATDIEWHESGVGHDLHAVVDGKRHRFQITRPTNGQEATR